MRGLQRGQVRLGAAAQATGLRFLRPDHDDPRDHIALNGSDPLAVEGLTNTGEFTVRMLDLNRRTLRRVRELRSAYCEAREVTIVGLRALKGVRLDELPRQLRAKFDHVRKKLEQQQDEIELRLLNRLDPEPDPELELRSRERRKYLREIRAVYPDPWTGRARRLRKTRDD